MQQRKNWVDWAKVLGMFFIIYGHCFPETMTNFVYAFNVPVFFLISGYLCKKSLQSKFVGIKLCIVWLYLIIYWLLSRLWVGQSNILLMDNGYILL